MALISKPPVWAYCTTNFPATPSATALGTGCVAGANDADGSVTSAISAITHDVEYIIISFSSYSFSAGDGSTLIDLMVDPAGGTSWESTPLISDLLGGYTQSTSVSVPPPCSYHFPLWIKSGTSIGFRARTAHTAGISGRVIVHAFGGNANPSSWWCGQTVETIGVDDTVSAGTAHTPGDTGAYSTWANFGSTLSRQTGAIQFGVHGTGTDTNSTALAYHYEFGVGSARIGHPIIRCVGTAESGYMFNPAVTFCNLGAGTQLQVRGTCSGTAEILDVAAYAVS